ncbi:MAG: DoxX family protein [Gaiellales bacterium]
MKVGKLMARVVIGGLFVGHGTQKLFGWFEGPGIDDTAEGFEKMGMRPGRRHATAAGLAETAGGVMLALGLFTPLAASMLSGVMFTAIRKVHFKNGLWVTKGGYEYNLVLLAALMALTDAGPGSPSLDSALGIRARGAYWAVAELAAGAAGSQLALISSEPAPAEQAAEPAPQHETPLDQAA